MAFLRSCLVVLATLVLPGTALAQGPPIMALSDVHGGMDCTGETVVQGTAISTFGVHVIDVVQDPVEGARILVSVSGPAVDRTGIAEGFSGSPVLCDDGTGTMRTIGAISEGIGEYGNKVGLVTPIESMLREPVKPPSAARDHARRPLGALMAGGLSAGVLATLEQAAQLAGRVLVPAASGSATDFPVQPLVPGASVAAMYSSGAVPVGAIGTVTYTDGQTVYAFGHPLDGAGRRSLLLQDAYVYYVVNNPGSGPFTSYKLAAPGHTVGTLTSDTPNAVIGQTGAPPPQTEVAVSALDLDTRATLALSSEVADEADVGLPMGVSPAELVAPLQIAQAASQIYDGGPANQPGRMCLTVTLRESSQPLQFCNRYVTSGPPAGSPLVLPALAQAASSDAANAISLVDQAGFARLHMTRIAARLWAARGLRQAVIVSAHAPRRVKAGQLLPVRLRVRVYQGPVRTIAFKVRLPRGLRGRVVARISGPGEPGGQSLVQLLGSALGGAPPGGAPGPITSMAALRRAFAQTATYDGLQVRFGRRRRERAYRDPNLLIIGQARIAPKVTR